MIIQMSNEYRRLFNEDVKELNNNDIPEDLQIPILTDRYVMLLDYSELLSLCSQIQDLDSRVPREVRNSIWKRKVEHELRSMTADDLFAMSLDEEFNIYLMVLLSDYEISQDEIEEAVYEYDLPDSIMLTLLQKLDRVDSRLDKLLRTSIGVGRELVAVAIIPKITNLNILDGLLSVAVRDGLYDIVVKLSEIVTSQYYLGEALITAAYKNRLDMVDQLLGKVTDQAYLGEALLKAIEIGSPECVERLLVKVTHQAYLSGALIRAIDVGMLDVVERLIEKVTGYQDRLGQALIKAINVDLPDIVERLLVKVKDQKPLVNALVAAIEEGLPDIAERVLVKVTDRMGLEWALIEAVERNDLNLVEQLIAKLPGRSSLPYLRKALKASSKRGYTDIERVISRRIQELN